MTHIYTCIHMIKQIIYIYIYIRITSDARWSGLARRRAAQRRSRHLRENGDRAGATGSGPFFFVQPVPSAICFPRPPAPVLRRHVPASY